MILLFVNIVVGSICEDMVYSHSFGRMWKFECKTDSCESNKVTYTSIIPKRSHFFEINCAAALAFHLIGKDHSGAKNVASILNIDKPINPHSCKSHTESISLQCEKLLDKKLKEDALNAKLYLQNIGQFSNLENAINQNIDISVSFDRSWNSRGWSSRTGIVSACFEPTGKVLNVILKSTHCKNCEEKKKK